MKQMVTPDRLWRFLILAIASSTFWLAIHQSPSQPFLVALIAACLLGIAVDLLILPRVVLWQLVPSIVLVGVMLVLPSVAELEHDARPSTGTEVLLVAVALGLVLLLFLTVIALPSLFGATLAWTLRSVIAERNVPLHRLFGVEKPISFTRIGKVASRAIGVILVIGTFVLPAFIPFHGTEGAKVASPDGRYVAWVRESNCGATCSFHPWIVVRDNERRQFPWFWRPDEATVFDTRHTSPSEISLSWTSDRHLVVTFVNYNSDAITIQKPAWNDVRVTYNAIPR